MTSKFWWALRSAWHRPSSQRQCYRPNTFILTYKDSYGTDRYLNPAYASCWRTRDFSRIVRVFWRDLMGLVQIVYWGLMWLQPFRCNGNYGGWRTRACDWLENRARAREEAEDAKELLESPYTACIVCKMMRTSDEDFYEKDIRDYHDGRLTIEDFSPREQAELMGILVYADDYTHLITEGE